MPSHDGLGGLGGGEAFTNTDGAMAPLAGYSWKRSGVADDANLSTVTGSSMQLIVARMGDSKKCLFVVRAIKAERGKASLSETVMLRYQCPPLR